LDEVLVAREVQAPVDVLGIIAVDVFAMPGEFDGEPRQGRLVRAGQAPQNQAPRLDLPIGHPRENLGVEVTGEDALQVGVLANQLGPVARRRERGKVWSGPPYAAGFSYFRSAGTLSISMSISFSLLTLAACAA